VAAVLFGAGALRTSRQAGTDHMAGSVGLALGGALLVAFVAAIVVAQLRASVEQRKVAVLGSWLTATTSATGGVDAAFTAVGAGSVYAIAAMGLVVTYKTSGVFNFAHGAVGMAATYVFYSLRVDAGWPTAPAAAVAVLGVGPAMGVVIDRLLLRRLVGAPSSS